MTEIEPVAEAFTWRDTPVSPGPAAVFDVDGVLSDATARQHYVRRDRRDWDGFFSAAGEDPVIEATQVLVDHLDPGLVVVLLTARPTRVHEITVSWLHRHEIRWDLLIMRPDGDRRPSTDYKRDAVRALAGGGFELRLAFEDDPRNITMLRDEGVPAVYLHSGYYE